MKKLSLERIDILKLIALSLALLIFINFLRVMVIGKSPTPPEIPRIARGNIVDRNGRILAFQKEVPSVSGWVTELKNEKESAQLLAPIIDLKEEIIYEHLTKERETNYFYIKRKITEEAASKIDKLIEDGKLKGIRIEREFGRSYPEGELTAHITGYVGHDNIGLNGIEYTLNSPLSPKQIKSTNRQEYGHNIHLTIDLNLQYFSAVAAKEAYESNFADSVSVITMDAKNGEILSYVSYPTYDPNLYNLYTQSERTNRITQKSYEPGSVYKVFSVASFLELGGLDEDSEFFCDGVYINEEDNVTINCLGNHGDVTPEDILVYSCNDGTAQASETVSQMDLYKSLRKFGFGNQTGIILNGESNGILRETDKWSVRSKPTISIGQETSVSAMQVITAATALTNSGVLLKPHIVKRISTQDGITKKEYNREPVREVISPEVASSILDMMKATTERGTGRLTKIEGLNISTKTGTSQITDPETGAYDENRFIASALAIFPTEDPEVIMYVVIENPKGSSFYGSKLAVPVIKNLVDDFTNYLNISTDSSPIHKVQSNIGVVNNKITIGDTLPDLTGLSKRVVLPALNEKNISFNIVGTGVVIKQDPVAGTDISPETIVKLEFE